MYVSYINCAYILGQQLWNSEHDEPDEAADHPWRCLDILAASLSEN